MTALACRIMMAPRSERTRRDRRGHPALGPVRDCECAVGPLRVYPDYWLLGGRADLRTPHVRPPLGPHIAARRG